MTGLTLARCNVLVDLRRASGYTYTACESQRRFAIEIGERDYLLQVMGVSAQSACGGGKISFTLSAVGSGTVDVLNIAVRAVKRFVTERECEAGLQRVWWNGVSDCGTKVPGGMYLIRVPAMSLPGGGQSRSNQSSGISRVHTSLVRTSP